MTMVFDFLSPSFHLAYHEFKAWLLSTRAHTVAHAEKDHERLKLARQDAFDLDEDGEVTNDERCKAAEVATRIQKHWRGFAVRGLPGGATTDRKGGVRRRSPQLTGEVREAIPPELE